MKVAGSFHLTYCSNIHPGETWQEVNDALVASLPRLRQQLAHAGPMAIGLRLSARAAETLESPEVLSAFRDFLREGDYYVFTMNGFPYGAFHGQRVKEQAYLPDWRDEARVQYTNRLARLLAAMLADRRDIEGSVSTVPGGFRTHVSSDSDVAAIRSNILRHAVYLVRLREETGVTIALALEPEPACLLETAADAVDFFSEHLFNQGAVHAAARSARWPLTIDDVHRHIGVCLDTCHMAVEFEDPKAALKGLEDAGIRLAKVQISSALQLDGADDPSALREALGPFAEDTYLHQVVARGLDGLTRHVDLPEALAAADLAPSDCAREWRVHFHVPVFLSAMGVFTTTQPYIALALDLLKRQLRCPYLEVETYTWDVLPAEYRAVDVCTAIARELAWVRRELEA